MPFIRGQFVSPEGEPARTLLRCVLLGALRETVPGIMAHLFEDCIELARAGDGEALDNALRDWGECYRLTGVDGERNRWIIDAAARTVRAWVMLYPDATEDDAPPGLDWSYPSAGYWAPALTVEEEERWNLLWETRATAEARHRANGMSRAEARRAVDSVLTDARARWHLEARKAARTIRVTRPEPDRPGPPYDETLTMLLSEGMSEAEACPLALLMETGYARDEAEGIINELSELEAATPLPDVPPPDLLLPAPQFRKRKHTPSDSPSGLGPLARDFCWLAAYICTPKRPVRDFAPNVAHPTVVQRVQEAAARCEFELPDPLRSD